MLIGGIFMEEPICTNCIHTILRASDSLGNFYYLDFPLSEEEDNCFNNALNVVFGKSSITTVSEPTKQLGLKIANMLCDTITDACMQDFELATNLLVFIRKRSTNDSAKEQAAAAIKILAEIRQLPAVVIAPTTSLHKAIFEAMQHALPVDEIITRRFNQLQWEYINKRRSADYGTEG